MGDRLLPFRREHFGDAAKDREQRTAQQAAQKTNAIAGRYVGSGFYTAVITANVTTASATFADLAGLALSLTAQPNDILLIDFAHQGSASAGAGQTQIAVVDGGNTYASTTAATDTLGAWTYLSSGAAFAQNANLSGIWTVRSKGSLTVKIRGLCSGGGTLTVYGSAGGVGTPILRVQQLRKV